MSESETAVDRKATRAALGALSAKYHPPVSLLAFQVWSGDTADSRYVDAVALNLFNGSWHGFEVKASKADLTHDLENHGEKSAWIRSRVDFFWLVEAREGLIETTLLPFDCGILTLREGGLEMRRAVQRHGGQPDRDLFLAFAKRVAKGPEEDGLRAVREQAFKDGLAKGKQDYDYQLERAKVKAERLEKALRSRRPAQ